MALSNIFNEPRREITESVIGITLASGYLYGVYRLGSLLIEGTNESLLEAMALLVLLTLALAVVAVLFILATHALGDLVCNFLRGLGIDPRPSRRRP